ncbi:hypothetical protein MMC10_002804 [Thelotrema lepadinum]|nr:hypothetical protein [Thelotrema lepadinum]
MDRYGITQTTVAAGAALALAGIALSYASRPSRRSPRKQKAIPSPLTTLLPKLSESRIALLPYPPDFFPGARDVETPYGRMRVYEWGPETGKKVVMVPGDTTPAPIFGVIAPALVERGCRVIVFDTWGRGYSDSPLSVSHDSRLLSLQILFAVTSSPLSWIGDSQTFSIIGFSLGGGITMSFASQFPNMIDSIILLAPVGFIRAMPGGYASRYIRYHQWMPRSILHNHIASVVGVSPTKQAISTSESPSNKRVSPDNPDLPALWQWQLDTHEGFVHSFADTVQNGPIQHQHDEWKRVSDIICDRTSDPATANCKLRNSQILTIFGENDGVIIPGDTTEDMSKLLPGHVRFRSVPGDHGFPIPSGKAALQHIYVFWDLPNEG